MAGNAYDVAAVAFEALVVSEDIDLVDENGECQIVADEWTLILTGDPVSSVMIALDDESGEPDAALRDAISREHLGAIRNLDGQMDGELSALLSASPDELARALADLILD